MTNIQQCIWASTSSYIIFCIFMAHGLETLLHGPQTHVFMHGQHGHFNFKQELIFTQSKTYTSLEKHVQVWLHVILHVAQPFSIFKNRFDIVCWEAQQNYHKVYTLVTWSMLQEQFSKSIARWWTLRKLLLGSQAKGDASLVWKEPKIVLEFFEGMTIQPSNLHYMKYLDYCQKCTLLDKMLVNIVPQFLNVFMKGKVWATVKDSTNNKLKDNYGLKPEFLKWATNDPSGPLT